MERKDRVIQAIFRAIDDFNRQVPGEKQLEKSAETVLFGHSGKLDSLGLVDLILATEERIMEEFDISITLADEKAMSQKKSPFMTVATLADYIGHILDEKANE